MDVQDIRPGDNFEETIEKILLRCDLVIAVIGPRWLTSIHSRALREDFVAMELTTALRRQIPILPILVDGAVMPPVEELPRELAPLARRQALEVDDARFDADMEQLFGCVRDLSGGNSGTIVLERRTGRRRWLAPVLAVTACSIAVPFFLMNRTKPDINGTWIAEMEDELRRPFRIRLTLRANGGKLSGRVEYPTGSGIIQEGVIARGKLSFYTQHVPQFASEVATIRLEGEIADEAIHLTVSNSGGVATGVAKRLSETQSR
jgi:hypothetical protein